MIKTKRLIFVLIFIFSLAGSSLLFAGKSEKEVKNLIKQVEQTLDKYNESGVEKFAGKELSTIENYIKKAKALLDDGDADEAYYEIGKAQAYFKLIDAKKENLTADKNYKSMQEEAK